LAVPDRNPRYEQVRGMDQIPSHVKREIEHFFTIYKELESRPTTTLGWDNSEQARAVIVKSRNAYLKRRV